MPSAMLSYCTTPAMCSTPLKSFLVSYWAPQPTKQGETELLDGLCV